MGVLVEYDNAVTFELPFWAMLWWGKIELARKSVVVLLLFVGMIGRLKCWVSVIAWNLSLKLEKCRSVDMMTSYSRWELAFINKFRTPNQGIARRNHDRRRLLILAYKVPCPCFMVREFLLRNLNEIDALFWVSALIWETIGTMYISVPGAKSSHYAK